MTDAARTIDLDAARKARAESRAKAGIGSPVIKVDGKTYDLPAELPIAVLDGFASLSGGGDGGGDLEAVEALGDVLSALLGGGANYDALVNEHALTLDDLGYIIGEAYDVDLATLGN